MLEIKETPDIFQVTNDLQIVSYDNDGDYDYLSFDEESLEIDGVANIWGNIVYKGKVIGKIELSYYDLTMVSRRDIFLTFDNESGHASELYYELFNENGTQKKHVKNLFGSVMKLYYLSNIKIDEKYRGKGIGSMILNHLVKKYNDKPFFTKPFPLTETYTQKDIDTVRNFYLKNGLNVLYNSEFVYQ
jgi:GNAT superfamily N-acetyltransferase